MSKVVLAGPGSAEDDAVALHPDTMLEDSGIAMIQVTVIEEGMARATVAAEDTILHREESSRRCISRPAMRAPSICLRSKPCTG